MIPTVGRIVGYVLESGSNVGQVRPAMIVRVWNDDCVQLQVFTDGPNDGLPNTHWVSSAGRSENKEPRTWDWMVYQKGQAAKTEELEQELTALKVGGTE